MRVGQSGDFHSLETDAVLEPALVPDEDVPDQITAYTLSQLRITSDVQKLNNAGVHQFSWPSRSTSRTLVDTVGS